MLVCWTANLGAFWMLKAWYFHISKGKRGSLWSFHMKPGKKPMGKHSQREGGQIICPAKTKDGIRWDLEAENIKEYLDSIQNLSWDGFALFHRTIMLERQRQHSDLHHWGLCSTTWKKSKHSWFFLIQRWTELWEHPWDITVWSHQQVFRRNQGRRESLKI